MNPIVPQNGPPVKQTILSEIARYQQAEARLAANGPALLQCLKDILFAWDYGNDNLAEALKAEIDDARRLVAKVTTVEGGAE